MKNSLEIHTAQAHKAPPNPEIKPEEVENYHWVLEGSHCDRLELDQDGKLVKITKSGYWRTTTRNKPLADHTDSFKV